MSISTFLNSNTTIEEVSRTRRRCFAPITNPLSKMTTKDGTFEDSFARRMPLEIKQMVFKWAVSNNDNNDEDDNITDIEVELAHDNKQSLKSPALDLLATLAKWYLADVYKEAALYLTIQSFRWVFISNSEPYHSLLSVFYKKVPFDIRKRIKHVYLRKLRVLSLVDSKKIQCKRWVCFDCDSASSLELL